MYPFNKTLKAQCLFWQKMHNHVMFSFQMKIYGADMRLFIIYFLSVISIKIAYFHKR